MKFYICKDDLTENEKEEGDICNECWAIHSKTLSQSDRKEAKT